MPRAGKPLFVTRLLLKKYIRESALLFAACGAMLFAFCWSRVWIVCQFDLQQFAPLLKQFKPFERFSPVPLEQFLTFAGSIAMTFHEPVLILCVVVWSIARGSDVVSGELGRGTLEMLLAQPISRTRLLLTHAVVCTGGLGLLCLLAWAGIYFGIQTNSIRESVAPTVELQLPLVPLPVSVPIGPEVDMQVPLADRVSPTLFIAPAMNLFSLGFFLLALSTLFSCFDRYRWRTIGAVISVYVVQLLLLVLSKATDWTGFCEYLTFFSCYQPDGMVQLIKEHPSAALELFSTVKVPGWNYALAPLGMSGVLVATGLVFYAIAWLRFRNRDLPAPL